MKILKQNTGVGLMVLMTDSSNHISGKEGLALTITASKNGGAFTSITTDVQDRGSGWYNIILTSAHTDTLGDLAIHITASGADPSDLITQVAVNEFGEITSAVWDEALSSHTVPASMGLKLGRMSSMLSTILRLIKSK